MALTIQALANGQLPNAKGTLYTCPGATSAIVKAIVLVNQDTATHTVNLYFTRATSRRLIPKNAILAIGGAGYLETLITLEAGDLIEGDADTATQVDYTISGTESA